MLNKELQVPLPEDEEKLDTNKTASVQPSRWWVAEVIQEWCCLVLLGQRGTGTFSTSCLRPGSVQ